MLIIYAKISGDGPLPRAQRFEQSSQNLFRIFLPEPLCRLPVSENSDAARVL